MAASPFEVSVLFIPPLGVKAAALDAIAAGWKLVVLTEHIPCRTRHGCSPPRARPAAR